MQSLISVLTVVALYEDQVSFGFGALSENEHVAVFMIYSRGKL